LPLELRLKGNTKEQADGPVFHEARALRKLADPAKDDFHNDLYLK
jgi:hypothetical protein